MNNSEKFYDRLTFLYPIIELFLRLRKREFFRIINRYPTGRLLEIGVGNGTSLKYYARHEVIGIDTSKNMLTKARKNSSKNIQLFHMNGEMLIFQNELFDYVVLSHVIAVVEDPEKLFQEIHRVLKPNGKVIILNHFTPDNWLQYVDRSFEWVSKWLHFKSVFRMSSLNSIKHFQLLRDINGGLFSYFKILIYEKMA